MHPNYFNRNNNSRTQASFVQQYLRTPNLFIPPSKYFNSANRGYPDFSAVGSRLLTITGGSISVGAGTSAATPDAAALIALLNDARTQAGKTPLGFLNPMLYKMYSDNPATFNGESLTSQATIEVLINDLIRRHHG